MEIEYQSPGYQSFNPWIRPVDQLPPMRNQDFFGTRSIIVWVFLTDGTFDLGQFYVPAFSEPMWCTNNPSIKNGYSLSEVVAWKLADKPAKPNFNADVVIATDEVVEKPKEIESQESIA